jgi:gas vesicle protein
MEAASLNELKKALNDLESNELRLICLRLAKFKKDNKELLSYLLFEEQDEAAYIENIKDEISELVKEISNLNTYYLKKSLRRVLKMLNKQIRYSGLPRTEVELRIHFCEMIKDADMPIGKSTVLMNLYEQQLKKIHQAVSKLDEDIQFDYDAQVKRLPIRK